VRSEIIGEGLRVTTLPQQIKTMKELKSLYNGVMNDASIQRYSLGWIPVIEGLDRRFKNIKRTDEEFTDQMIIDALAVSKGTLHENISIFSRELSINIETLNEKSNKGTQRSPFGIGS